MKTTTKYLLAVPTVIVASMLSVVLVAGQDSHGFNLKYRLWKVGLIDYDVDSFTRFLGADDDLRQSLQGKSIEDVQEIFGDLRPVSESNEYQRRYTYGKNADDFYWIGGSRWGIEFMNGKLERFFLSKG